MISPEQQPAPLVLVTVGSDHHRFDRLVEWVDGWLRQRTAKDVRCVVQHGTSRPPELATGFAFVPHDDLQALMREATAVVTQGGPMGIVEARQAGRVPIVVPRSAALGEHVDDHQQAFSRRMAAEGLVRLPDNQQQLWELLNSAIRQPEGFAAAEDHAAERRVTETSERVGALVDQLVARRTDRPRVLLIAGSGRSGSTLLERAIGEVPGVAALGETVHMWERGVRDNELCGCGEPFSNCPFWSEVGRTAFGGWDKLDPDALTRLRYDVVRNRYIPRLLLFSRDIGWRLQKDRLARVIGAVYRAAADVTGASLLVDSSKMPAYAALLRHAGVDLHCVYVVRDPRGVAHSWAKSVPRPEVVDGSSMMPRYGAVESALWWSAFDSTFALLGRTGIPMTTVRYEDFVGDPRPAVSQALQFAGFPTATAELGHLDRSTVNLRTGHLVAGNPMRFRTGAVTLLPDEAWRTDMPDRDRAMATLLTTGLRSRHGYR